MHPLLIVAIVIYALVMLVLIVCLCIIADKGDDDLKKWGIRRH
jgi:hypothetical protein